MNTADSFWIGPYDRPDTYRLITMLGSGGEGEVWRASLHLSESGRSDVAVKLIANDGTANEEWDRFGDLLKALSHPGLVRVTDVFTGWGPHRGGAQGAGSLRYVVMDHIDGLTLRDYVAEHPDLGAAKRLRLLNTPAAALDTMHSGRQTGVPVAHGDVKPANIVVREDGSTVLVDMGLARLSDAAGRRGASFAYAPPEMRHPNAQATPEGDAYAFAVTVASVLTGTPPPTGPDGFLDRDALHAQLVTGEVTRRRPTLVREILGVLTAAPADRPRNLGTWLASTTESLSRVTTDKTMPPVGGPGGPTAVLAKPRGKRNAAIVAAVLVLLLVGVLVYAVTRPSSSGVQAAAVGTNPTTMTNTTTTTLPATTTTPPATATTTATSTTAAASTTTTVSGATPTGADGSPVGSGPTYLSSTQAVGYDSNGGGYRQGAYATNGVSYGHSLAVSPSCGDGGDDWIDYNLSRAHTTFTATVGVSDDSAPQTTSTYSVLLDGKVAATGQLRLGMSVPLTLPVTGVLRLRLLISAPKAMTSCNNGKFQTVWGDAQVS